MISIDNTKTEANTFDGTQLVLCLKCHGTHNWYIYLKTTRDSIHHKRLY